MTPLQQFNSMIQFYCTAHSGDDADISVFENNGRVITRVGTDDWVFTVKVHQAKPKAEVQFFNHKDDTVDKSAVEAPTYHNLMPLILAFHWKCMSEVAN